MSSTQVYRIHIKASPQRIWDAITTPEWTSRYGYRGENHMELRPGGAFRGMSNAGMIAAGAPELGVDGEIVEVDPPFRLVQTWRMLMDPDHVPEGFTRLTYELKEGKDGITALTVTHEIGDEAGLAQLLSGELEDMGAGGGWPWILSDLKSLLETGSAMAG
ncbi:SRPBCC family protein [Dactylosporangium aurantiacum]|uniref:SRPBCC family protein n=1 Tax=Dactylosporangium aurantiacum TaxID=35754 RepID=A0A9Q9I6Q1_9ACTN|nr:SRPBCC family protein [Dactylosporangium aurantiacum]MDG6109668.1 SRPBCC family protein [Dactylosporangium aurantiacum]UWZ50282.1 SRPBCC family protein [Dactylosporangium aurantiacum]